MKSIILTTIMMLSAAAMATATTNDCKRQGGGYMCGNIYVDGSKAESEAEALAIANAKQEQTQGQAQGQLQGQEQGQGQSQSSTNDNSNSSSISNVIEGAPSLTANIGLNISLPIASGVQTTNAINTANWLAANGYREAACAVMQKAPRVRNSGIKINCTGDKG